MPFPTFHGNEASVTENTTTVTVKPGGYAEVGQRKLERSKVAKKSANRRKKDAASVTKRVERRLKLRSDMKTRASWGRGNESRVQQRREVFQRRKSTRIFAIACEKNESRE